jgi:peroxiredoxin
LACSSPPSPSTLSSSTASEPAADRRPGVVRYLVFALIVLCVPISLVVRRAVESNGRIDPLHAGPAPAFTLQSVDGGTVSLADFRGRGVVVNFFGAWCEQCRNGLPLLVEMQKNRFPAVPIVGILYKEAPDVGQSEARAAGATWPILVDPDWKVAASYGVASAPATFFIRADGTIAGDLLGPVSLGILQKQFEKISP